MRDSHTLSRPSTGNIERVGHIRFIIVVLSCCDWALGLYVEDAVADTRLAFTSLASLEYGWLTNIMLAVC